MTEVRGPKPPTGPARTIAREPAGAGSPAPDVDGAHGAHLGHVAPGDAPMEADLPSTSAAPLSREVAANLQAAKPASVTNGARARLVQVAHLSADAIQKQVERFLADPAVQLAGQHLKAAAAGTTNVLASGVDAVVTTVGAKADDVGLGLELSAADLDALATAGQEKLQGVAAELRARGAALVQEAEALRATPAAVSEQRKGELEKSWAVGHVLVGLAERIEALTTSTSHEVRAFLALGGSALLKVTSDVLEVIAELTHKGGKAVAAALAFSGRVLKRLFGTETQRSTALSLYGGVRANFISQKLNAGIGGGVYFPSLKSLDARARAAEGEHKTVAYADAVAFDWGVSAASPVAGAGWSSRGGAGAGVNLYFISATFNAMTERVFIGIPGVWGVTLGRDVERGSEINFGNAVGLAGGDKLGAYASWGVALHTPLLDPINEHVTRPIAKVIVKLTEWTLGQAKAAWTAVALTARSDAGG